MFTRLIIQQKQPVINESSLMSKEIQVTCMLSETDVSNTEEMVIVLKVMKTIITIMF